PTNPAPTIPMPIRFTAVPPVPRSLAQTGSVEYAPGSVDVFRAAAVTVLVLSPGCAGMLPAWQSAVLAQAQTGSASPASKRPPESRTPESYPAEQVKAGTA